MKWPDDNLEAEMLRDAEHVQSLAPETSIPADLACHVKAVLSRVRELEQEVAVADEQLKIACQRAESYKAALAMVTQFVSNRATCMIAQAALDGADMTDEATALRVCEGKWRKSNG